MMKARLSLVTSVALLAASASLAGAAEAQSWTYVACDYTTRGSRGAAPDVEAIAEEARSAVFRFTGGSLERYLPGTGLWEDLCVPGETFQTAQCDITEMLVSPRRQDIQVDNLGRGWGETDEIAIDRRTGTISVNYSDVYSDYGYAIWGSGHCQPTEDPRLSIQRRF